MMNPNMYSTMGSIPPTVVNPSASRIPKWRPEKLPPIHCPKEVAHNGHNSPTLFKQGDISDISTFAQPPSLRDEELRAVLKVKAQRKELDDHLKGTVAQVEHLKRKLKDTKLNIEKISTQLESPQGNAYGLEEGDCDDPTAILYMAKENLRLQRDLLEHIDVEESLTNELETAQRELWGAGVADHYLSMEVEEKLEPVLKKYDKRKSYLAQKRILREKLMKQNAEKLRKQTLTDVVKSMKQANEIEPIVKKSQASARAIGAKNARKKVDTFIRKTMHAHRQKKLMEIADHQLKQDRQQKLLTELKNEMDDQKDALIAMSQMKQKRDARIAAEKQKIRDEFASSGKNPYYVEHLLAIEEKRTQQQRKVLEKEQERLAQLQREYEISEKAKHNEEMHKKKWDNFWAKKLKERKEALKSKQAEFYDDEYDHSVSVSTAVTRTASYESVKNLYPDSSPEGPPPTDFTMSTSEVEYMEMETNSRPTSSNGSAKSGDGSNSEKPARMSHTSGKKSIKSGSIKTGRESIKSRRKTKDSGSQEDDFTPQQKRRSSSKKKSSGIKDHSKIEEVEEDVDTSGVFSMKSEEYAGESNEETEIGSRKSRKSSIRQDSSGDGDTETIVSFAQPLNSSAGLSSGGDVPTNTKPQFGNQRQIKPGKKEKKPICPFRWQPNVITFSDYDVGKTYKKVLTVTCVSSQRVKFYLKDFVDLSTPSDTKGDPDNPESNSKPPISSLVRSNFQVSKALSPGLSQEITFTFSPPVLEDWKGVLKFESSTIPFEVEVQCLKKRFVPVLSSVKAVFTNVVADTSAMISIKITNAGAKDGVISQIVQTQTHPPVTSAGSAGTEPSVSFSHTVSRVDVGKSASRVKSVPLNATPSALPTVSGSPSRADTGLKPKPTQSRLSTKSSRRVNSSRRDLERKKSRTPKKEDSSKMIRELLNEVINSVSSSVFVAYVKECKRDLEKNSTRTISLLFRPPSVDNFKATFDICFDDPEVEKLTFKAVGASVESPVLLDPQNTDFRICMMDHNYQQLLSVSTTVRGHGKVIPEVPKELRPFVDISPKEINNVFLKNPGRFSVKFRPTSKMLAQDSPALKYIDTSSMIMDFPISFNLKFPYKLPPLTATFMAVVANQSLEFFPRQIDMGKCSAIETVQASLSIFNDSMLPQDIGFVEVPDCISIQPNYGFATLLPHEKRDFSIILSLPANLRGENVFILKCQTLTSRQYSIPVRVYAKTTNIQLSQTRIYFPVTAVGSCSTTTIEIFSNAPEIHSHGAGQRSKFEFYVAPELPLTVLPRAGYIEPRKTTKIQVRFDAQVSEEDVRAHLVKMLERDHIESQGMLQRELDGINATLKYEMVFGEDDLDEEFVKHLTVLSDRPKSKRDKKRRKSGKTSFSMQADRRKSFINKAPTESGIRLSDDIQEIDQPHPLSLLKSGRRGSRRKSQPKEVEPPSIPFDSDRPKKKSLTVDSPNKRRSSEPEKHKRKSKGSHRNSMDNDTRNSTSEPKVGVMLEAYKMLEKRRDEVIELLASSQIPPNVDNVQTGSKEYSKAKRDLVKHLATSSHIYSIPCFVTDEFEEVDVHLLIATCPMSHPSLTLLDETNTFDFGPVAVGSMAYREVRLYNVSQGTLKLKMDILNPYGPFVQCNALRKIPPDHIFTLKLRFQPDVTKNFDESIRIFGGDSRIVINLKGEGVAPEYNLKPMKSEFHVGTIHVGELGFQEFEISNSGSAELNFTVDLLNQGQHEVTSAVTNESELHESEEMGRTSLIPESPENLSSPISSDRLDALEEHKERKPKKSARNGDIPQRSSAEKVEEATLPEIKTEGPKRKSLRKSELKRKSRKTHPEIHKILNDTTFEVEDGDTKLFFHTTELLAFLEENKKQYFFQSVPSNISVPPQSSKKFSIFFVPVESGSYEAEFQVRLNQAVVHRFSIFGVGEKAIVASSVDPIPRE